MRQYSSVQHVRIGEHDVPLFADGFARVARRVAVISEDAEAVVEPGIQIVQLCELILRESLGGNKYSARLSELSKIAFKIGRL